MSPLSDADSADTSPSVEVSNATPITRDAADAIKIREEIEADIEDTRKVDSDQEKGDKRGSVNDDVREDEQDETLDDFEEQGDDDDDDDDENDSEQDDDMPKWEGGLPRAPTKKPVTGRPPPR